MIHPHHWNGPYSQPPTLYHHSSFKTLIINNLFSLAWTTHTWFHTPPSQSKPLPGQLIVYTTFQVASEAIMIISVFRNPKIETNSLWTTNLALQRPCLGLGRKKGETKMVEVD
jgi:hypothetical protein